MMRHRSQRWYGRRNTGDIDDRQHKWFDWGTSEWAIEEAYHKLLPLALVVKTYRRAVWTSGSVRTTQLCWCHTNLLTNSISPCSTVNDRKKNIGSWTASARPSPPRPSPQICIQLAVQRMVSLRSTTIWSPASHPTPSKSIFETCSVEENFGTAEARGQWDQKRVTKVDFLLRPGGTN